MSKCLDEDAVVALYLRNTLGYAIKYPERYSYYYSDAVGMKYILKLTAVKSEVVQELYVRN